MPGATLAASSLLYGEGSEVAGARALLTSAVHGGRSRCTFSTAAFVGGLRGQLYPWSSHAWQPPASAVSTHFAWTGTMVRRRPLCRVVLCRGLSSFRKVGQAELPASGKKLPGERHPEIKQACEQCGSNRDIRLS